MTMVHNHDVTMNPMCFNGKTAGYLTSIYISSMNYNFLLPIEFIHSFNTVVEQVPKMGRLACFTNLLALKPTCHDVRTAMLQARQETCPNFVMCHANVSL